MRTELKKVSKVSTKEIWVTGQFDKHSRKQFEEHGWKVINHAEKNLIKDS